MITGRRNLLWALLLLLPATSGCLSLGGSTTHVHDNPKTDQRISALESRVHALESMLGSSPAEVVVPQPRTFE